MSIHLIPAYDHKEDIRTLFGEYTKLLIKGDPEFQKYLEIQHYGQELEDLEAKYGLPCGRLYIVLYQGKTAGCAALRKIDDERCEMKRLYVRQEFRGHGIGSLLTDRLIADAREIGYRYMLLDTFPFLEQAISIYRSRGFQEIEKYNDSPMESTIYMMLQL